MVSLQPAAASNCQSIDWQHPAGWVALFHCDLSIVFLLLVQLFMSILLFAYFILKVFFFSSDILPFCMIYLRIIGL